MTEHIDSNDEIRPYHYSSAGKLLEDFWKEVEKVQIRWEKSDNEDHES